MVLFNRCVQIMFEKQKISGLLNNCAMNCGLPILLDDISVYAGLEIDDNLPNKDFDLIFASYSNLKKIFCDTYGLQEISWDKFNTFLISHDTFLAKQMLFLPVFRSFIAEVYQNIGPYEQTNHGLSILDLLNEDGNNTPETLKKIGINGKYKGLSFGEAFYLFYRQFGINVNIYTDGKGGDDLRRDCYIPEYLKIQGANRTIDLCLNSQANHFEMGYDELLEQLTALYDQKNEVNSLNDYLHHIMLGFSSTQSASETELYMSFLKHHVKKQLNLNYKESPECAKKDKEFADHKKRFTDNLNLLHDTFNHGYNPPQKYKDDSKFFLSFRLFTNVYFQLAMTILFISSLFILIILLTASGQLPAAAGATVAFKALLGTSISGLSTSTPALTTSVLATNFGIFDKKTSCTTKNNEPVADHSAPKQFFHEVPSTESASPCSQSPSPSSSS